ncbi:MAG: amidohydrolase family protein [Limibacillus sp.]|jgi:imidazolonepropionase-like amidohydrolase
MNQPTHHVLTALLFASLSFSVQGQVQGQDAKPITVITNANVFNGVEERLMQDTDLLIEGNLIKQIGDDIAVPTGAKIIDAAGRTLIPGLIDAHWHTYYANAAQSVLLTGDMSEVAIIGFLGAEKTLMRGFTTVRDVGGNPFAVKKLTDTGEHPGPRIFASGPPISQTSGHFDFGLKNDHPKNLTDPLSYWERNSLIMTANGVPEVILRTRENLRMGATQIKISGGGGVSSSYDDLDVQQFTYEEMKAAVDVAKTWNTYVAAHIFTDEATQTALRAGVLSIEHGFLISEKETWDLMKEKGAWISLQPLLDDEDALQFENPYSQEKYSRVTAGTDNAYKTAKKLGINIAFGTDMLFDPVAAENQGKMLAKLKRWFTPYEALRIATSENARLLELAGPRNPYRDGSLGVIEEGAYADLILVDGNPLENLDLIADPHANFDLIMKDGKVYKNALGD